MGNLFHYTELQVSPDNTCLFPGCHRLKYSNFNYCGNTYDKCKHRIFVSLMLSYIIINYNVRSVESKFHCLE